MGKLRPMTQILTCIVVLLCWEDISRIRSRHDRNDVTVSIKFHLVFVSFLLFVLKINLSPARH